MVLKNKKVLMVGLGKTGVATARFLRDKGALVTATDIRTEAEIADAEQLRNLGINIEAGGHRVESFLDTDLIIVSPGVPLDIDPLQRAGKRGIPIISEVELACDEIKEPIVGITGTNGKTTTTALIGEVFREAGIDVFVGGNIGRPLIGYSGGARYVIAELSSFQLEGISKFRPFIAVMLSISEDHLDRYPDLDSYKRAKERIFRNQRRSDYAILNLDDPIVRDMRGKTKARVYWFSSVEKPRRGVFLNGLTALFRDGVGGEEEFSLDAVKSPAVMHENVMAAILATKLCGVEKAAIQQAIISFKGLPHRCEWVAEKGGVGYYDDSKGTNVGAVVRALQSFDPPIILIAGGRDKGGSYAPLRPLIEGKVKTLILIGEARNRMAEALAGTTQIKMADSMEDAVRIAHRNGQKGFKVLLSPACSSFDMFENYEERGRVFQEAVRRLSGSAGNG